MAGVKYLFFSTLLILLATGLFAQSNLKDCDDIKVQVDVSEPNGGAHDGSIKLTFDLPLSSYNVYLLNAGVEKAKHPVSNGIITGLKSGFYDILIVHLNKKGCYKQLTVTLK